MTANKRQKKLVRTRAAKAGQTYSTALLHLRESGELRGLSRAEAAKHVPFTPQLQAAIRSAADLARELGHSSVTTEHLVLGALSDPTCAAARRLGGQGVTLDAAHRLMRHRAAPVLPPPTRPSFESRATEVIEEMTPALAASMGHSEAGTDHMLIALAGHYESLGNRFLDLLRVDVDELRRATENDWLERPESWDTRR